MLRPGRLVRPRSSGAPNTRTVGEDRSANAIGTSSESVAKINVTIAEPVPSEAGSSPSPVKVACETDLPPGRAVDGEQDDKGEPGVACLQVGIS